MERGWKCVIEWTLHVRHGRQLREDDIGTTLLQQQVTKYTAKIHFNKMAQKYTKLQ